MAAIDSVEMKPPRSTVGLLAWLRKNLFSTWYNVALTLLGIWLLYLLIGPAIEWATTEARWGVIEANLTLFMIGQYPREQIGRVWLCIYILAVLLGLSWGVWKNAARGFALIALGAGAAFILISLYFGWDVWDEWLIAVSLLLVFSLLGRYLPRGTQVTSLAWFVYFPLVFFLIAGTPYIATLRSSSHPPADHCRKPGCHSSWDSAGPRQAQQFACRSLLQRSLHRNHPRCSVDYDSLYGGGAASLFSTARHPPGPGDPRHDRLYHVRGGLPG
jgi:hypothetical protein